MTRTDRYTLVSGIGTGSTALNAFDAALLNAEVGNFNLLKVSSILPPQSMEEKHINVLSGSLLPIAYGSISESEPGLRITAAVAVGIPQDFQNIGVIMEYSDYGEEEEVRTIVIEMAREAMNRRNLKIGEIKCASASCVMGSDFRCAFAGVALWKEQSENKL